MISPCGKRQHAHKTRPAALLIPENWGSVVEAQCWPRPFGHGVIRAAVNLPLQELGPGMTSRRPRKREGHGRVRTRQEQLFPNWPY